MLNSRGLQTSSHLCTLLSNPYTAVMSNCIQLQIIIILLHIGYFCLGAILVKGFRVTCLFTGQYNTEGYDTITREILTRNKAVINYLPRSVHITYFYISNKNTVFNYQD